MHSSYLFCTFLILNVVRFVGCSAEMDHKVYPTLAYLVEGDSFVAYCDMKYKPSSSQLGAPDGWFVFADNTKILESDRIKLNKTQNATTRETKIFIAYSHVTLQDAKSGLACRVDSLGESVTISIYVISKETVPNITVGPSPHVLKPSGSNVVLTCKAQINSSVMVESVKAEWSFVEGENGKLPPNAVLLETSTANLSESVLTLNNADILNSGKYVCDAILILKASKIRFKKFSKAIDLAVKASIPDEYEKKVKAGEDQSFDCLIAGKNDKITWYKGDLEVDNKTNSRYIFEGSAPRPNNTLFTIKKVTYTDRGVYKCSSLKMKDSLRFTLRVRDPLGALWPFIGIVVEVILLVIIILACEAKKKGSKKHGGLKKNFNETSPLVKNSDKVSYSGKDGSVRTRLTTNNAADA